MSSPLEQSKESERLETIMWACKCLLDEGQASGKRLTNLSILKSCIEDIRVNYDVSSVCQTLRKLLKDTPENDEIYKKAHTLLISIIKTPDDNQYYSKNMKRITASILFLDLQGFSSLRESEVRCFFEDILKDLADTVISKCQDCIDDINTWGDGLIIITKDPYAMARLALDIRDFYRNYDWDNKRMPKLLARIALHHGAVYRGFDYFRKKEEVVIGTEVTLGARLEPIVEPNQIWCTSQFKSLIKTDNDKNLDFEYLGNKNFAKDFGEFEVYKLRRSYEK
jgi:class 3 adenylate cyclase